MLTKDKIIEKIEKNKEEIKNYGVRKLILVGSYASGKAKNDSDIDFVIEFKKGRGLFDDYIHLLHFLEDLFKKDIDLGEKDLIRKELKHSILGGNKIEARI